VLHDYHDFQPSKKSVIDIRRARIIAGRQGGLTSGKVRRQRAARRDLNEANEATAKQIEAKRSLRDGTGREVVTTLCVDTSTSRAGGQVDNPDRARDPCTERVAHAMGSEELEAEAREWGSRLDQERR
jgi:hypothetical protein